MSENANLFRNVENDNLDCRLFGYICDSEERGGFFDLSEVYLAKLGAGTAQTELPIGKDHLNWQGFVGEAVYATSAISARSYSVFSLDKIGSLRDFHLEILQKAQKGTVLIAVAKVVAQSEMEVKVQAEIKNQEDKLLAQAEGTFVIESDFVYTYADYLRKIGIE